MVSLRLISKYHCSYKIQHNTICIPDHLGGFDKRLKSYVLDQVVNIAKVNNISNINVGYVFSDYVKKQYSINFLYTEELIGGYGWEKLKEYKIHPDINFKNFICSFNGSDHVGRQLLSSILNNQEHFNPAYSSKNFAYGNDWIVG